MILLGRKVDEGPMIPVGEDTIVAAPKYNCTNQYDRHLFVQQVLLPKRNLQEI